MEQLTEKHQGKIVEMAIKKTGYQMKALAKGLGIARNTLYLRLKEERLDDSFIINVSNIIHYDFSKVFPDVYKRAKAQIDNAPESVYQDTAQEADPSDALPHYDHVYKNPYFIELQVLTRKYIRLMEDYHKLLKTLTLLANSNELVGVKKEILAFLEEEDQED